MKLRNLWPSAFADTDDAEDIGDENPGANDGHAAADADSVVPGASEDPGYSAHAPRSVHGDATEASNQGIASISVAAAAANVARLNVEGSGTDSEAVVADGYGNVDYGAACFFACFFSSQDSPLHCVYSLSRLAPCSVYISAHVKLTLGDLHGSAPRSPSVTRL